MFQAMSAAPSFAQPAQAEPTALPEDAQPEPQPRTQAVQTVANAAVAAAVTKKAVTAPQPQQVEAKKAETEPTKAPSPQSAQLSAAQSSQQEQASLGSRNSPEQDIELQRYNLALLAAIERNKYYPNRARRRHQEGTVTVAFIIDLQGVITRIRIVESSSHPALDDAAISAIKRVGQFQPLPESIGLKQMEFRVPLSFELDR